MFFKFMLQKVIICMKPNQEKLNKSELRAFAKSKRSSLSINKISQLIIKNIKSLSVYENSKNILSFYPFNSEIDLREFFIDQSKYWYLPRVDNFFKNLEIKKYKYNDTLVINKWGVSEPEESLDNLDPGLIELVFLPALMSDKNGYRLGYGAGFYDRFLPLLKSNCIKIIPVPDDLLIENLPYDSWDIPADYVITEKQIIAI